MTFLFALRYFIVVAIVPRVFLAGFVVAVAAAAARLTSDPSAAVEALTPVFVLQLFVAASGFQAPARRGHFDLLLTSGTPRWQVGLAHCIVSVGPGIIGWLCVGMFELAASHGSRSVCVAGGTCAAFLAASLATWGMAVYSSRVAVAIGWVLVMTIPPIAGLVSPLRLLGAADPAVAVVAALIAAAIVPFAGGLLWVVRGAMPLEASQ